MRDCGTLVSIPHFLTASLSYYFSISRQTHTGYTLQVDPHQDVAATLAGKINKLKSADTKEKEAKTALRPAPCDVWDH